MLAGREKRGQPVISAHVDGQGEGRQVITSAMLAGWEDRSQVVISAHVDGQRKGRQVVSSAHCWLGSGAR